MPDWAARWYAVRVRSNCEFLVTAQLEERSLDAFLPYYVRRERLGRRDIQVRRPLFRGYVFACFDAVRERSDVLRVRGVVSVVSSGRTPEPLGPEVMAQLHAVARDPRAVAPAEWRAGEAVTVASGPLAGLTGVVERSKGARRLVILVGLLNRACAVEIGEADVYRASSGCGGGAT